VDDKEIQFVRKTRWDLMVDEANDIDRSPESWWECSTGLWEAAELLTSTPIEGYSGWRYHQTAAMLRAMAVEDVLKAIWFLRQLKTFKEYEAMLDYKKHWLRQLAEVELKLDLTEEQLAHLEAMEVWIYLGRYPALYERDKTTGQIKLGSLLDGKSQFELQPDVEADTQIMRSIAKHFLAERNVWPDGLPCLPVIVLDDEGGPPDQSKTAPDPSKTTPDQSKTTPDPSKTGPDKQ
jgi:hypothetical protein